MRTTAADPLPFPTPPAVQDLLDELADHGLPANVEPRRHGLEIVVWAANTRVYASAVFVRRRKGFAQTDGSLIIDGHHHPPMYSMAELRRVFEHPDLFLNLPGGQTFMQAYSLKTEARVPNRGAPVTDTRAMPGPVAKAVRGIREAAEELAGITDVGDVTVEHDNGTWLVIVPFPASGGLLVVVYAAKRTGGHRSMFLTVNDGWTAAFNIGDSLQTALKTMAPQPSPPPQPSAVAAGDARVGGPGRKPSKAPRTKNDSTAARTKTVIRN